MPISVQTCMLYELAVIPTNSGVFERTIAINAVEAHIQQLLSSFAGASVMLSERRGVLRFADATKAASGAVSLIGTSVQSPEGELAFRVSLSTGPIDSDDPDVESDVFKQLDEINKSISAGEAVADHTTYLVMNRDMLPWVLHKEQSHPLFPALDKTIQLLGASQCTLHKSLQEVLRTQPSKVLIASPDVALEFSRQPDAKTHVILTGYKMGAPNFNAVLASLPSILVSTNIWYQSERIPLQVRKTWEESGKRLIVATDDAMLEAVANAKLSAEKSVGSSTVMAIDLVDVGDLMLDTVGVALPKVPLQGLINGYGFDLLSDGAWGFAQDKNDCFLTVDIQPHSVSITSNRADITVNGRMALGQAVALRDGALIRTPLGTLRYLEFSGIYRGIIIGIQSHSQPIFQGDRFEIGREPNHPGLALPVRGGEDRIQWMNSSKAQRIKGSGWSWDRSWVGRRQSMVQVNEYNEIWVSPIHERLPTLLYKNGQLIQMTRQLQVEFGDMIIVGTTVLGLSRP